MRVVLSVLANWLLLFALAYFLPYDADAGAGIISSGTSQLYLVGGTILGVLNAVVRPILKIIWFPFIILSFGLFILVINAIILRLLEIILKILDISWVRFEIEGLAHYAMAVAIFTVFNILYNLLFR